MKCLSSRVNDWTLLEAKYHSCVFNWQVFPLLPLTFWPVDLTIWWISLMIMTDYVLFRLFTVMAVIYHTKSEGISGSSFWISHMHLTSDLAQPCLWVCKIPSGNSTWFQTREVIHASYNEPAQDDMQEAKVCVACDLRWEMGQDSVISWPRSVRIPVGHSGP